MKHIVTWNSSNHLMLKYIAPWHTTAWSYHQVFQIFSGCPIIHNTCTYGRMMYISSTSYMNLQHVRIHMLFVYFTRNEVRCTISLSFLFFDISHITARILINSIFRISCIIFQPTTSNYTLLYQSISCCILDYYFILSFIIHNIMNYDAVLYHIMSIYSMLCHVILYHIVLHYIHIILHHIILYCIVSWYHNISYHHIISW